MEKARINVSLTPWQLAQCERLVETAIDQLILDGLASHAVTKSMQELLSTLNTAR